tara:strand:+ start:413 stop:1534 length:1122 start_codon:yes stop_codon:yes gene_type:complete
MREFLLNNIKATGTTTGDVYFPQTKLLLPFDGTNGATSTSDLSDNNGTVTFVGNAQISTAQSKVGGSSLYLDGTGDYLTIPTNTSFNLGNVNFTIECWIKTSTASEAVLNQSDGGAASNSSFNLWIDASGTAGIYLTENTGWDTSNTNTTVVTDNVWHHVAAVRNGSSLRMYVDGVSSSSTTFSGTVPASTRVLEVGAQNTGAVFNGYIDQARFTQGVARYTSTFTPPTTAHLTSAGDVNKQIIVNSAADGVAIGTGGINQARIAKAWVSFNTWNITLAILGSYNVSSVTDHGAGDYEVIFATAMSNANYSQVISSTAGGTWTGYGIYSTLDRSTTGSGADDSTTTSFGISTGRYGYGSRDDCSRTTAVIFGD